MISRLALIFTFIISANVFARELYYSVRSPKALLMGDAYTTLAEDDYTLFYNPAILARHSGFSLFPLPISLTASDPTEDMDRFESLTDVADSTSGLYNQLSGFPIHAGASIAPSLKMGQFGLTVFSSTQSNITLLNNSHPMIDIYHTEDNGFIAGFAKKFGNVSFGASIKYLKRRGVAATKSLYDPDVIDGINAGGMDSLGDFAELFGGGQGKGWGFDLGMEYYKKTGANEFAFGISATDVANTKLYDGEEEAAVPEQPMRVSMGVSWKADYKIFDYILSADLHPLLARIDNNRRIHLGFEVGTPVLRLLGGYNAGYYSYGAEVDLGMLDVYAGFYDVEIGSGYNKKKANRFLLYVSLFDFDFDM